MRKKKQNPGNTARSQNKSESQNAAKIKFGTDQSEIDKDGIRKHKEFAPLSMTIDDNIRKMLSYA